MRLILIDGVPSWQDGDLTLPVVAGGQEDPFDDIFGPDTGIGDTTAPYAGRIFSADGNQLLGTLSPPLEPGGPARLRIAASGSVISFPGGTFRTETNHLVTLSPAGAIQIRVQAGSDPVTGVEVRNIGGGLVGVFDQDGNLIEVRSAPSGPSGSSAPAFGSTKAAADLQIQAAKDAAALLAQAREDELEAAREQAEIDRELRLREARLATARDLVNIRSAEAREARTQGTQLAGEDPFRFLSVARGGAAPPGTTPSAAFKQDLAGAGNFQAPDLAGLDSAALESVIAKLSQSITPEPSPFGFAHGGTLSPSGAQGGSGAQAVRVGEAGPEILILRPDGSVEVVPEMGSAQSGGTFNPLDLGGFTSLFNRLRRGVGLGGALAQPGSFGGTTISVGDILQPGQASALGSRQAGLFERGRSGGFVRQAGTAQVFAVTDEGLRAIPSSDVLRNLGASFGDVKDLTAGQFARLLGGVGRAGLIGADESRTFNPLQPDAAFGAFGEPISTRGGFQDLARARPGFSRQEAVKLSNLIGFLPAPFKIPPSFFQSLLPQEKTALLSAYRLAGFTDADFNQLLTAPRLSANPIGATAVG